MTRRWIHLSALALVVPGAAHAAGPLSELPVNLLSTVVYSLLGLVVFGVAFVLFNRAVPFSVRKEIEEDQNVALGVIIGAMLIGMSIIIAAAIV